VRGSVDPAIPSSFPLIEEPLFYLCAIPAVLIAGLSKGGLGGGLGVIAVPLISLAISPVQAAGIMLPILCCMDLVGIWAYWRKWDGMTVLVLVGGSLIGIAVGALSFRYLDASAIRLITGSIAVAFALDHWLRGWFGIERLKRPGRAAGVFWGGVSGFTSTIAHAGSPPISIYLLPQGLQRTVYQATTVFFFMSINYIKLIPYTWLGQFSNENLATSAVLLPFAIAGAFSGVWVHNRVSETLFFRLCYGILFAVGAKLVFDGITGMLG